MVISLMHRPGLDQEAEYAHQLFVAEAALGDRGGEQLAALGDAAHHGVAQNRLRWGRLRSGGLVAEPEQHGVLGTEASPPPFPQGGRGEVAFFEEEPVKLLEGGHCRPAVDGAQPLVPVRAGSAVLLTEPLAEALHPPAELTLVLEDVWTVASGQVHVTLEPDQAPLAGQRRAPRVDVALELARQPPFAAFPQPGCGQVAEVDEVASLRLMGAHRDPRVEERVPDVELPPFASVIGMDQHVERPTEHLADIGQTIYKAWGR